MIDISSHLQKFMSYAVDVGKQPWLTNSKGEKDASLTFAAIGLTVTCLSILASAIDSISFGETVIDFAAPNETLVLGMLGMTLGNYWARRQLKDKLAHELDKTDTTTVVGGSGPVTIPSMWTPGTDATNQPFTTVTVTNNKPDDDL